MDHKLVELHKDIFNLTQIKKDEQDKIFSQFYRAGDELTQNVKGSGIGLTIVKGIVEAHQGTVKLKSEPGKGSDFQIVLPLKIK